MLSFGTAGITSRGGGRTIAVEDAAGEVSKVDVERCGCSDFSWLECADLLCDCSSERGEGRRRDDAEVAACWAVSLVGRFFSASTRAFIVAMADMDRRVLLLLLLWRSAA